jgi:hypothetical protein
MANLTPSEFASKWNRRIKQSVEDVRAGVQKVSSSPTEAAAAKQDKMRARVIDAIDSGKWAGGLSRVSLDEWKSKTINKGVARIPQGADEAQTKVQSFASELLPYIDSGKAAIERLPDLTLEDSITRMTTWTRHMAGFRRSGTRR